MSEENEESDKEIITKFAKILVKLNSLEENAEENIKKEKKCGCGNIALINANYCDKCGRKLALEEKPKVVIKKIQLI
jgi:hypothetical protein